MNKLLCFLLCFFAVGCCGGSCNNNLSDKKRSVFSIAISDYPSAAIFNSGEKYGMVNFSKGKFGSLEDKYGIDIVLKPTSYSNCVELFGEGIVNATCISNVDAMVCSKNKSCSFILPTSVSVGADACIVSDSIQKIDDLKNYPIYGPKSCYTSEYLINRLIQIREERPDSYNYKSFYFNENYKNLGDKKSNIDAIVVRNPLVINTLKIDLSANVVFDSSSIENEIVDGIVVDSSLLHTTEGDKFCKLLVELFYSLSKENVILDESLFKGFDSEEIKIMYYHTRILNPEEALFIINSDFFCNKILKNVAEFSRQESYGVNSSDEKFNLTSDYLINYISN